MAMALLARTLTTKPAPFSSLLTRSFSVASRPSLSSSASALKSFRPLAALAELGRRSQTDVVVRSFSSRPTTSSLNDPSPNWNNRPPKETILLDGCDFEHWLVVVEPPQPETLRDDIIDSYIKTLAQVVGSEEEARHKIYSVSTKHYFAFGALVSEELSYKLKELPGVRWVLPDSYLDVKNKDYGGEPFIDGQAVPYDPKYHEEWVRNNARANERSRRNDRPRNNDRSRNFERRRENMQNRDVQMPNRGMPNAAPNMGSGPPNAGPPNMAPNAGGMPPRGNFQNMPPNQNVPSNPGMSPNGNFQNMPPNPNVAPNAPYRGGFPPNGNMQQNPSMQYNAPNKPNPNMQYNAPNANMQYNAPGPNAGYSNNMPNPSMQYNAHGPNTGGGIPPYQNQGGYQNGGYQNNYAPSANAGGPPGGNNNYQVNDVPGRD